MAASDTTRMLVLGVAQLFEPANGYQLRRELLSWDIEDWANIKPGSVYSMLATLTKQGMLVRTDIVLAGATRPVAVYTSTDAGRDELLRLLRDGLTTVSLFDQTWFYASLSLMVSFLSTEELLALLAVRQENLASAAQGLRTSIRGMEQTKSSPPHVARVLGYAVVLPAAELEWLNGFVASIRAGEMFFAGEHGMERWQPLPDDPAWGMVGEREAYLAALRRSADVAP